MTDADVLPIYVINLDQRPDRLKLMKQHLTSQSLPFVRESAVDGLELGANRDDISLVSPGHLGSMASHRLVWDSIAQGASKFALILEDDAELDSELNCPVILKSLS